MRNPTNNRGFSALDTDKAGDAFTIFNRAVAWKWSPACFLLQKNGGGNEEIHGAGCVLFKEESPKVSGTQKGGTAPYKAVLGGGGFPYESLPAWVRTSIFRYLKEWTMCWLLGPRSLHCHMLPDLQFSCWRNVGVFVLAVFGMNQFVTNGKEHNKGKVNLTSCDLNGAWTYYIYYTSSKQNATAAQKWILGRWSDFFSWVSASFSGEQKLFVFNFASGGETGFLLKPQGAHHVIHIKPNVASKSGDISSWPVANPGVPNARISLHHQRIYSW